MPDLKIRLTIPILTGPGVSAPGLTFARWLPLDPGDAIHIAEGDVTVRLAFQIESVWWANELPAKDIERTSNVLAHRLYAGVTVAGVTPELLEYVRRCDLQHQARPVDAELQAGYDRLAERVLAVTLGGVNRLIAYIRGQKGQYWLSEYEIDLGRCAEMFDRFEAEASFRDLQWFRFRPSNVTRIAVALGDPDRYIRSGEWQGIRQFVESCSNRPPLAGVLLAGAEELAAHGHSRSALTEAVAALEVALYAFARSPAAERAFGAVLAKRMGVASLYQQVEHLGLSASIRYLLPILLTEDVLPTAVLIDCRNAIDQRNTVVHQGQREVTAPTLRASLSAIRAICGVLGNFSQSRGDDA
ncbi:MAG: hypothetical protein U0Q55_13390 [Vicinamibacterales bacterium]